MDNSLVKQLEVLEGEFQRGNFRSLGRMQILRRRLGLTPLRLINDLPRIFHEGAYYKPGDEIPLRGVNLNPSVSKSIRRKWFHWEGLGDRPEVVEEPKAAPKKEAPAEPEPKKAAEEAPKKKSSKKKSKSSKSKTSKKSSEKETKKTSKKTSKKKSKKKTSKKTSKKKSKSSKKETKKTSKKEEATFWDGEEVDLEDIEDALQED